MATSEETMSEAYDRDYRLQRKCDTAARALSDLQDDPDAHFSKGAAQGIREVRDLLEVESARIVRAWD